jgi:hypothetical protein
LRQAVNLAGVYNMLPLPEGRAQRAKEVYCPRPGATEETRILISKKYSQL